MPPRISHEEVTRILAANGCDLTKAAWLAIRGYYLDSIGVPGRNDRNQWDDAWCLYSPQHGVLTYRANTDPTSARPGTGTGANKGRASLAPGVWLYGNGPHKGRIGFRQCAPVLVMRDAVGGGTYPHWGFHAINIHDAAGASTSSEGCQTIPRPLFSTVHRVFLAWLEEAQNPWGKNDWEQRCRTFEYVLIEETERRQSNITAPRSYKQAPK
jgi:lysozyme